MEQYFKSIIDSLSIEDMNILSILHDEDCNMRVKAMSNSTLFTKSGLTEAIYRKVISKLQNIKFIESHLGSKQHCQFISEYGREAISNMIELTNRNGG